MRPDRSDYADYWERYISLVPDDDILATIERQSGEVQRLIATMDDARASHRYAEGKWSVKEVIGHMTDAERVFGYRILSIARGDEQSLPGFDENEYVRHAGFDAWRLGDLAESYALVRRSNIVLLRNLPEEAWDRRGTANDNAITPRALVWVIAGHERHHLGVLRDRYRV